MQISSKNAFESIFSQYAELSKQNLLINTEQLEIFIRQELPKKVKLVKNIESEFNTFLNLYTTLILKKPQHHHLLQSLMLQFTEKIEKYFHCLELTVDKVDKKELKVQMESINLQDIRVDFRTKIESLQNELQEGYFNNHELKRCCQQELCTRVYNILQIYHFCKTDSMNSGGRFRVKANKVLQAVSENLAPQLNASIVYLDTSFKDNIHQTVIKKCRPFINKRDFLSSKIKDVLRETEGKVPLNITILTQSIISKQRFRLTKQLCSVLQRQLKIIEQNQQLNEELNDINNEVQTMKKQFRQIKNTTYFMDIMRNSFEDKYKMEVSKFENIYYMGGLEKYLQTVLTFLEKILLMEGKIANNRNQYVTQISAQINSKIEEIITNYEEIELQSSTLSEIIEDEIKGLEDCLLQNCNHKHQSALSQTSEQKVSKRGNIQQQRQQYQEKLNRIKTEKQQRQKQRRLQQLQADQQRKIALEQKMQVRKAKQQERRKAQEQKRKKDLDKSNERALEREKKRDEQQIKKKQEIKKKEEAERVKKQGLKRKEQQKQIEQQKIQQERLLKQQEEKTKKEEKQRERKKYQQEQQQIKEEKRIKEEQEKKKKMDEQMQMERERKERKEQEERDRKKMLEKEEKDKKDKEEQDKREKQEQQRKDKLERQEKKKRQIQEQEKKEKAAKEKREKEEREQKEKEAKEKKDKEERSKKEKQKKQKQEQQKREKQAKEKKDKEERQKREKQKKQKQEQQKREKQAKEKKDKQEQQKKDKLQKQVQEKKAKEKKEKQEQEKLKLEKQAKEKREKEEQQKKNKLKRQKQQMQRKNIKEKEKGVKEPQRRNSKPKNSSGLNYDDLDDILQDDIEEMEKANKLIEKAAQKNPDQGYQSDFEEEAEEEGQEESLKTLINKEDLKCLNDYLKGTQYLRKTKLNFSPFNKQESYNSLFGELIMSKRMLVLPTQISEKILIVGKDMANDSVSEEQLHISLMSIRKDIMVIYVETMGQQQFSATTQLIFPFNMHNEFNIKVVEINPYLNQFKLILLSQLAQDESTQISFSNFMNIFIELLQLEEQTDLKQMVIDSDSISVLNSFQDHIPCLLILFAMYYECSDNITINQFTVERLFYTCHSAHNLEETIENDMPKVKKYFENQSAKFETNPKVQIRCIEMEANGEWNTILQKKVMNLKKQFLEGNVGIMLVQIVLNLQDDNGELQDRCIIYVEMSQEKPKPLLNYYLIITDMQQGENLEQILQTIIAEDNPFATSIYTDNSRHFGLAYHNWTLTLWAHIIQKKKTTAINAMRVLVLSLIPYYIAFKEMD